MRGHLVGVLLAAFVVSVPTYAHQPVMDMAPRWTGGFGFQLRYERYGSDELLLGTEKQENTAGLKRYVNKTWLEGVYTFKRSVRVTFKLPYIDQQRISSIAGDVVSHKNKGVGDLIIGVPLKHYVNQGGYTSNLGITPSIRIPSGSSEGDFPLSDGSWDFGISVAYAHSTPKFYQFYDLFYWNNTKGARGMQEGDEIGLDINWGYHPYHDNASNSGVFLMWDITARNSGRPNVATLTTASGGDRVSMGPVVVFYRDAVMVRAEYKFPVYEKLSEPGLSRGQEVNIGLGITF